LVMICTRCHGVRAFIGLFLRVYMVCVGDDHLL
jgi:hypothetical protein